METKFLISKCSLIPSEGSSLKENYDIVRGNPIIDYYESVESPSIALTITFIDIDQVISREGITGGEYVDVTVKIDGFDDFKIESKKHKLMLNSVKNVVTETSKQFASLEFVSVESIINETARVNKKFTDNVSQTIFELLIGDKKGIFVILPNGQAVRNLDSWRIGRSKIEPGSTIIVPRDSTPFNAISIFRIFTPILANFATAAAAISALDN